jgi:diguanylate cyclase (GGDEF)-like protein/PAS domain S-box-containing protein
MKRAPGIAPFLDEPESATRSDLPAAESGFYRRTLHRHLEGIVYRSHFDIDWSFELISGSCRELTGYSSEDLIRNRTVQFDSLIYGDDRAGAFKARREAFARREPYELEFRVFGGDGLSRWISDRGSMVRQVGECAVLEGVMQDITARKLSERAVRDAERSYRGLFEFAVEGIFRTTADGQYLAANPALARIYGFESAADLVTSLRDISQQLYVDPARREAFIGQIRTRGSVSGFESQVYRRDGSVIWIVENARAVYDSNDALLYYEGTVEDITERKVYEARLERQANFDALTGLANRSRFNDRLEQAVLAAAEHHTQLAVVFLDLDRFKFINDRLGHAVGDRLLQCIAERLRSKVRDCDTVGRFGGDEFLLLVNGHSGAAAVRALAEALLQEIARPWTIDQETLQIGCSVGVALFPADGLDANMLIRNADTAMYRAKQLGGNVCQFFTEELNQQLTERLELQQGLGNALGLNQFQLNYQSRIDLNSGAVVGAEALLRWDLPGRGSVSPTRFIPIAEETGLIIPIGQWVIEEACRQIRDWRAQGLSPPPISVNVAAAQVQRRDFVQSVVRALEHTGIEPQCIELEITESQAMHDAESLVATLRELKDHGIALSIDDFGTGYSSLSYLKRFAVDRLKVDRAFIADIEENTDDVLIVRAIIALGRSLGLRVVAEGVETLAQANFLRENGCHEAQGYYYSRPVEAELFVQSFVQSTTPKHS